MKGLKLSRSWRSSVTSTLVLLMSLFVAGCANHQLQTNGGTTTGREPLVSSAESLPLAERLTFYTVPLQCPAAPEIGCGSRAKPVLQELERVCGVNEAWLNRAGTELAVVWVESGSSKTRMKILKTALNEWKLTATELTGKPRAQALREFQSGAGWHRADDVDRLSEEEAGIIAARFVRRIQSKTPLPEAKAETLRSAMTDTLKKRFLGSPEEPSRTLEQEREAFLESAASYLNETELTALREAIASGYRPLLGE